MTADRFPLTERIRAALAAAGHGSTPEKPMFGCRAFMVDDKLAVAVRANSDLLVRIDPARCDELLRVTGAKPAEMGAGRTMGPGWLDVATDALDDDALALWTEGSPGSPLGVILTKAWPYLNLHCSR